MKSPGIDLIPAEVHERRSRRRRLRLWIGVLAAMVLGQVAVGLVLRRQDQQVKAFVAQASELRQVMQVVRENNGLLSVRIQDAKEQLARLDRLAGKHRWSRLLDWLSARCPSVVVLTHMHVDAGIGQRRARRHGPQRSQEAGSFEDLPMPETLVLSGYAADHPGLLEFIALLKQSEAFAGVSLLQTRRERLGDGEAVDFTVLCQW